ncbi:hypothetical protein HZS_1828 [Henneguya salminicola]|nr:hypothetical protein HZS_1828 [Henneguya salminicola]
MSNNDYMIIHDIDLFPLNSALNYKYPMKGPYHIADPRMHPIYHYKNYIGGILSITLKDFNKLNGMSNDYWGWGREDDDLYKRMKIHKLQLERIESVPDPDYPWFIHDHSHSEKRDTTNLLHNTYLLKRQDLKSGITSLKYKLINIRNSKADGYKYKIINNAK